ncbi:sugar O-acyltransferase, sialic acid O-acetyltransferase NeuD family [Paenimyroides ummariense]|uniref:Sugar O-acyltransferase, sialic acid O-acetyltransferase NeuD family n=1 Tax=Paenimyroides ummariense TaxID=913024 RepID=A0A1I5DV67_9FLAO|nr:acetyltransferase [Paenimyroides ummariense]SFO03145.1 sugar O-acyltransferase, sialic acid O-acetyltransferase NeuD family [Paenimyroides ummariense]
MKKIAIFGAGGFGREVKTIIDEINKVKKQYDFVGFFDDGFQRGIINGFPVLGGVADINQLQEKFAIVIAIGDPKTKAKIHQIITNELIEYPNIIHPKAMISDDYVEIGIGNIITAGCIITCNIKIEDFVILNLMCTVGHDTTIKSYASFMPSVNISGEVIIHEKVYVGTGAKIINQLEIGQNTIVGAGAVVAKTLPENCTAVGIPAKTIKFHE